MKMNEKIALLRRRSGWSQEQLAEWMNVSRQTVSKWESGRATPATEHIVHLSRLFGVTTDHLLLDEQTPPSEPAEEAPVRRITESDTYRFAVRCQIESRRYALACASLPVAPAIFFLACGASELVSEDVSGALCAMGFFFAVIALLLGLSELLCSWLGSNERRLNDGQPCVLNPEALSWAADAWRASQLRLQKRTSAALAVALLAAMAFVLCLGVSMAGGSDFWIGAALGLPCLLLSVAVYLRARAARMDRCYRYLIQKAREATAG